jgi:hypothetical protein
MSHENNGHANLEDLDDVDLLALRYVMDELTADQLTRFEARLAADQDARESVSQVVLLGTAIVRDSGTVTADRVDPAGSPETATPWGGWRLPVAAILLLAIGLAVYVNRDTSEVTPEVTPEGTTAHIDTPLEQDAQGLIAWVEFGEMPDVALAEAGLDVTGDPFERVDGSEVTLDIGAEAPSWMLQALTK